MPKSTAEAPVKPEPVMVIFVPELPILGVKEVMVGVWALAEKANAHTKMIKM